MGVRRDIGAAHGLVRMITGAVAEKREKKATAALSPEEMRTRNLELVEARIRQLRGKR